MYNKMSESNSGPLRKKSSAILMIKSVSMAIFFYIDPNTLNLDPDPGFWPNFNPYPGPDPDPSYDVNFKRKNVLKIILLKKVPVGIFF